MGLKDTVSFAYDDSMQRDVRNECGVLSGDMDPLYLFDKEEGAGDKMSRDTVPVEMTEKGNQNSAIEQLPGHSIGVSIDGD